MKKKVVRGLLAACIVCAVSGAEAEAADFVEPANDTRVQNENIQTYRDNILVKYRTHNGKKQYRRWDNKKQCWLDPYWIDA